VGEQNRGLRRGRLRRGDVGIGGDWRGGSHYGTVVHTRLDLAAVVLQRKRKRNLDVVIQVAAYESKQKELAMHRVKS
jgi:hypothetical protein